MLPLLLHQPKGKVTYKASGVILFALLMLLIPWPVHVRTDTCPCFRVGAGWVYVPTGGHGRSREASASVSGVLQRLWKGKDTGQMEGIFLCLRSFT